MAETSFIERAKSQLEWLQHGDLIIRILGSFGIGTALRAYLKTYTKMDASWITPIWLIATTVLVAVLMFAIPRWPKKKESTGSPQDIVVKRESGDVEEFYRTYDNVILLECETNVKKESVKYKSGDDREKFLTRWFSAVTIGMYFENTWLRILGSQIRALEQLNRNSTSLDIVRTFYDGALKENPLVYAGFPFETWFWFLTSETLVLQNGLTISITVRGREFLKYLVHCGRSAMDRAY